MLAEADTSEANSYLASHISMQIHMEQVAQLDQNETAQLQNMSYKRSYSFKLERKWFILSCTDILDESIPLLSSSISTLDLQVTETT